MDYNKQKLERFVIHLRNIDPELAKKVHELAVDNTGELKSIGGSSSDDEWEKTVEYWNNFSFLP